MQPDESRRPPEHVETRPATYNETVAHATKLAGMLAMVIQQANIGADPLLSLHLLPLIADAAALRAKLAAIEVALETRP